MIINICKIMYKKQMHILNDVIFGENDDYYFPVEFRYITT